MKSPRIWLTKYSSWIKEQKDATVLGTPISYLERHYGVLWVPLVSTGSVPGKISTLRDSTVKRFKM